jgi:hypothetical protein
MLEQAKAFADLEIGDTAGLETCATRSAVDLDLWDHRCLLRR